MGVRPDDHEPRRNQDRQQTATDDLVCQLSLMYLQLLTAIEGDGTFQKADAEITRLDFQVFSTCELLDPSLC